MTITRNTATLAERPATDQVPIDPDLDAQSGLRAVRYVTADAALQAIFAQTKRRGMTDEEFGRWIRKYVQNTRSLIAPPGWRPDPPGGQGSAPEAADLHWGALSLDRIRRVLRVGEHRLFLQAKECDVLAYFMANPERVLSAEEIAGAVWPYQEQDALTVIRVYIRMLRDRLEAVGLSRDTIRTVRGSGYLLTELNESGAPKE